MRRHLTLGVTIALAVAIGVALAPNIWSILGGAFVVVGAAALVWLAVGIAGVSVEYGRRWCALEGVPPWLAYPQLGVAFAAAAAALWLDVGRIHPDWNVWALVALKALLPIGAWAAAWELFQSSVVWVAKRRRANVIAPPIHPH